MRRWICVLIAALAGMSHALAAQSSSDGCSRSDGLLPCPGSHTSEPVHAGKGSFEAELAWVMDGDSLRARIAGELVEVRLADIDSPEYGQPYAWEAKLALIDLVRGQRLTLVPREVDRHDRMVARVWAGEVELSRELVIQGAAWFYPAYARNPTLREHEQRARSLQRGLWGVEGSHVAPWIWRKQQPHSTNPRHAAPAHEERRATRR
jgi:endonuclease YncB( thermonuclease family)